jgi:hypothetical protein
MMPQSIIDVLFALLYTHVQEAMGGMFACSSAMMLGKLSPGLNATICSVTSPLITRASLTVQQHANLLVVLRDLHVQPSLELAKVSLLCMARHHAGAVCL